MEQAHSRLCQHLRCRPITGVAVTLRSADHQFACGRFTGEDRIIVAVFSFGFAGPFAGVQIALRDRIVLRDKLCRGLSLISIPRQQHLVVAEVFSVAMTEQEIRAVNILRVDRRHDERRAPAL